MRILIFLTLLIAVLADGCFYNCTYSVLNCEADCIAGSCSVVCTPYVAKVVIEKGECPPMKGLLFAGRIKTSC